MNAEERMLFMKRENREKGKRANGSRQNPRLNDRYGEERDIRKRGNRRYEKKEDGRSETGRMDPVHDDCDEGYIEGKRPVLEALKSGRTVEKLLIARGSREGSIREIYSRAREAKIVIQEVDRKHLDEISGSGAHQGVLAFVTPYQYVEVEDILSRAEEKGEAPFLIVLDEIMDPHNLGAILRTAECCGAHGVILPKRRSVGMTPVAMKASAGAAEYLSVAKVSNLVRTLEDLKQRGIWIAGAATEGVEYTAQDLTGPIALVIGSEGKGIGRLIQEKCDFLVRIPLRGRIESLNASVAAGVLMYEVVRQRG